MSTRLKPRRLALLDSAAPPLSLGISASTDELRDYQFAAVAAIRERLQSPPHRCHLALPTGTGKTRVAGEVARTVLEAGGRVLVLAHRRELVEQLAEALSAATSVSAGVVMGARDAGQGRLVVACVATLRRAARLEQVMEAGPVSLVVVDEGHHATATNSYGDILKGIAWNSHKTGKPMPQVLGLSATPYRLDGSPIEDVLGPCAFTRGLSDMVEAGWLAPLRWEGLQLPELTDVSWVRVVRTAAGQDFEERGLAKVMAAGAAVRATTHQTAASLGTRRSLVFAVDVAHAQALAAGYRAAGLTAAAVWGAMPAQERTRTLADWRSGHIQVVTNCGVLAEGFDFPQLEALVIARPTLSPGLYLQMVGRVTRLAPGKTDGLVIDVAGNELASETRPIQLPDFGWVTAKGIFRGVSQEGEQPSPERVGKRLLWGDPFARSRLAWLQDPDAGFHVADALGVGSFALVPDQSGTGLFSSWLWVSEDRHPGAEPREQRTHGLYQVAMDSLPLGRAVATVDTFVVEHGLGGAGHKGAAWRAVPPSQKQLDLLRALDPKLVGRALEEEWSRGDVSLWITVLTMRRRLGRLTECVHAEVRHS
jgi:superfamily II DNA or RNA helicase